jgi:uncharacterized protein
VRKIVIAGGSGQVGDILRKHFAERGDQVIVLSRSPSTESVLWDGKTLGDWARHLDGSDLLINLSGRSVNCRYNDRNRHAILNSRVQSTRILGEAIALAKTPPRVWMNASTATIYRHALDRDMDEQTGEIGGHEPGAPEVWGFSIHVARQWEEEFASASVPGVRKIALRSAIVMSVDRKDPFGILLGLARKGLGGKQGRGDQFVSWIHETDFVRAIEFLIEHESMDGVVNLAAPNPFPNSEFMRAIRSAWGIGLGLPVTRLMLEVGAFFMRTETELVLKSRRVVPGRLQQAGFIFQFPQWAEAAVDLVRRWKGAS